MQSIPTRLLPHSITWRARSSIDDHGKPTYGNAVTVDRCMDARGDLDAIDVGGDVIVPMGRVVFGDAQAFAVGDELTLPDGQVARVLRVMRPTGPSTSAHHVMVVYG